MNSAIFKNKKPLVIFLLPAFIFMAIFLYYPFINGIINSFYEIKELGGAYGEFIGVENYRKLISDARMQTAMKNTFIMMGSTIVFQVGTALVLALMVDMVKNKIIHNFFRTAFFFPIVISATAIGLLFNLLVLYDGGLINQVVNFLGGKNIDWKSETNAMITMIVPVVWQYVGFYFVVILTGINSIPDELYESADIDGAGTFGKIRFITLPLLYNVLTTCLVLSITGSLKVFDLPWTMFPKGIPFNSTFLTGTYMYQQTFHYSNIDYGSAIAVIIVLMGVALSQLANNIFKPKDY